MEQQTPQSYVIQVSACNALSNIFNAGDEHILPHILIRSIHFATRATGLGGYVMLYKYVHEVPSG